MTITMVAAFPPPVGGAAVVSAAMRDRLHLAGAKVSIQNVGAPRLHVKGVKYHLKRLGANVRALASVSAGGDTLYIVPDGGLGVLYSLAHVAVGHRRFRRLFIHHHTFRYINHFSRAMSRLVSASPSARHIFLSEGMRDGFVKRYGNVESVVLDNSAFLEMSSPATEPTDTSELRLGHLSNLCAEKGFFEVADAFDRIRSEGIDASLWLAGPVLEDEVQLRLQKLTDEHGDRLHYLGPLYGQDKTQFFASIDLFLFPTNFVQEAAPLVLYESFAAGTPVIAYSRGCIPEMVQGDRGAVAPLGTNFADFVLKELQSGLPIAKRRETIRQSMKAQADLSSARLGQLIQLMGRA